jgi:subtilisin family serine protease
VVALIVLLIALAQAVPFYRATGDRNDERVQNKYIVQMKEEAIDDASYAAFINRATTVHGVNPEVEWNFSNFRGALFHLNATQLEAFQKEDAYLNHIEEDQIMHADQSCTVQQNAIWNLARVSDGDSPSTTDEYIYPTQGGEGVYAYIVDTGILTTHQEFGTRASYGANYAGGSNADCNGHGTHVAGTVCGTAYGVAKKAFCVGVKVLDCNGSGTNSGVISGVGFVAQDCAAKGRKCVANMSLGGGYSLALNNAVNNAVAAGYAFVVAAGNENQDACNVSPASATGSVCVGATEQIAVGSSEKQGDGRAYFSNYGRCVTLLAPGVSIRAAWITSRTSTNTISGTSMASPHVCGVAALLLAAEPNLNPRTLKDRLVASSVKGVIQLECTVSTCQQTPNYLLHHRC